MATTKKEIGDKLLVKQFKNDANSWWCSMKHWTMLDGELLLVAGGIEVAEERAHMLKYLKNKKLL